MPELWTSAPVTILPVREVLHCSAVEWAEFIAAVKTASSTT
jgi:hypothetical protein